MKLQIETCLAHIRRKYHEIVGEDFHKMLLAIQNSIEYLNRNYFNDEKLEEEVSAMTKTLYDPVVEKTGEQKGEKKKVIEIVSEMLKDGEPIEKIIKYSKIREEEILELNKKIRVKCLEFSFNITEKNA